MSIAVGIDLGTYQCAIAVYINEEISVIPQDNGKDFMPSVVSFTHEDILIGHSAIEQYVTNPENTIFGVKRIIGKYFDDPQLKKFIDWVPYNVENADGNPKISVVCKGNKKLYDPECISAMILKKLKMKAEIILGLKIIDAVITVPSFFNDSQRQATKDAGSLAGLNVLRILNEPTAAAIAYGLHEYSVNEKYVLIYDFGTGMFSVSILKIKDGNNFETQSTAGDTNLGGFEVTEALVNYCADLFYNKNKKDIKSNIQAVRRLRIACSQAMIVLSSKDETVIAVNCLIDEIDFCVNISRSKFEDLCEDIFNETIELLHQVVKDSGRNKRDISDVVLIGGITKIPKVQYLVSNYFDGIRMNHSFNSSLAIAYGAAIQAAFLSGYKDRKIKNMLCVDVTSLSIGIEVLNGFMTIIIKKGTPIPVKTSYTITTHVDNQSAVAIRVFEGEKAYACNNHLLGTLELLELPPFPRGIPKVTVTFEIDLNGILTVSAEEKTSKSSDTMSVKLNKNRLSKEDIDQLRKETDELEKKDDIERARIQHRNALENYIRRLCKAAFTNERDKISSKDQLEIRKIYNEINDWLELNPYADVQSIIEKRKAAIKLLQPYANRLGVSIIEKRDLECMKGSSSDKQSLQVDKYES